MLRQVYYSFLFVLLVSSCGNPLPTLEGIDLTAWKDDKNGCVGYRSQSLEALQLQKDKIKALSETEIVKLLGRPDRNELYKRNQKFFHYFLEPGVVCGIDNKTPKRLSIRFNATERAKEVIIE